MSHWAFWRKRPPAPTAGAAPSAAPTRRWWRWNENDPLLDIIPTMLAWLLPSGAVVVSALGQFMLALVLLTVAFGVWLRLWRSRKKRRAMGQAMGRTSR